PAVRSWTQVYRRLRACDAGRSCVDRGALSRRSFGISAWDMAAALRGGGAGRRVGIGARGADHGCVLYVRGDDSLAAAGLERSAAAGRLRRAPSVFRNCDLDKIWRVNQTQYGRSAI